MNSIQNFSWRKCLLHSTPSQSLVFEHYTATNTGYSHGIQYMNTLNSVAVWMETPNVSRKIEKAILKTYFDIFKEGILEVLVL